ncbi:unnamed protein product [Anisakis simplex]|uniref:Nuclear hormone receptor,putative (inferred by orthology to a S. mansoni protein) n=1 Tax=Anisakis simplex TaxID=6269 RepID=A0A0M3K977_ANISI|nr:unnamed protein product [Anisakis simplex]
MPPSRPHIEGKCQVCNEPTCGYHFGVISCRACAAFFRRTVALQLKYRCRFEQHCVIDKSVQLNRDSISSTIKKRKSVIIGTAMPSSPSSSGASMCKAPQPSERDVIMARVSNIFECTILDDDVENVSILDTMLFGYEELLEQRETVHANASILSTNDCMTEEEKERLLIHNCDTFVRMTEDEIGLIARMTTYFRPFLKLPATQRMVLFERFWMHFVKLERAYVAFKNLGDDTTDDRVILFNGQVTSQDECLPALENMSNVDKSALERMFSSSRDLTKYSIYAPLKRIKPTEKEFIAICENGLSEDFHDIARDARNQIFSCLHQYYINEMDLSNYAPRIGEFMALVSAVERSVTQRKENALIIDLFDVLRFGKSFVAMFR